jgi:hypothetical protein
VICYKFLRAAGSRFVGPFSGVAWPAIGEWCGRDAVSGCRLSDLPYWVDETLWLVELRGPIVETEIKVTGADGRLVRHVQGWDRAAARAFAAECAGRVRELAVDELRRAGRGDQAAALERARAPKAVAKRAGGILGAGAVGLSRRTADIVGYATDAATCVVDRQAAAAAYVSARAHQAAGASAEPGSAVSPYLAERARQAAWFARELDLE